MFVFLTGVSFSSGKSDFVSAHQYLKEKKYDRAIDLFKRSLQDPHFLLKDYSQWEIANALVRQEKYVPAIAEYKKVVHNFSVSHLKEKAELKLGYCCLKTRKYQESIQRLSSFIRRYPNSVLIPEAKFLLAQAYENIKQPKKAYHIYSDIEINYPLDTYGKKSAYYAHLLAKKHRFSTFESPDKLYKRGLTYIKLKDYTKATNVFSRLAKKYPKSTYTGRALHSLGRIEYSQGKYSSAIENLEKSLKYSRSRKAEGRYYLALSYGRRGRYSKAIYLLSAIVNRYPKAKITPSACYYLGFYNEVEKDYYHAAKAYLHLAKKYPQSSLVDDAVWRLGRIYYRLGDYENAKKAFSMAYKKRRGLETSRSLYYWAKILEDEGNASEAAGIYYYIFANFDHTFHAYKSLEKLEKLGFNISKEKNGNGQEDILSKVDDIENKEDLISLMEIWESSAENNTVLSSREVAEKEERYQTLLSIGLFKYAAYEATELLSAKREKVSAPISLGFVLHSVGEYRTPIRYAEGKVQDAIIYGNYSKLSPGLLKLAYPLGYFDYVEKYSKEYNLDPYLVLALIREESRFNPKARSRSWARGLMQIIPSTGRKLAYQLNMRYYWKNLYNVETNVKMGTYYLSQLIEQFEGNVAFALAGYNGGPLRVKKWIKKYYNGDIDHFIINIPIKETRRYVQKVLGSYYEYKRIYGDRKG